MQTNTSDNSPTIQLVRLAIIGTNGHDYHESLKLETKHMEWIAIMVKNYITNTLSKTTDQIILVSGGDAWVEHVAVQLYREGGFGGLNLYLPSEFNTKLHQYKNTHEGRSLNKLHAYCQEKTGAPIFEELTSVNSKKTGVRITIQRGWKPRNTLIARGCDHLLAFTLGKGDPNLDPAKDIWSKIPHTNKVHFCLDLAPNPESASASASVSASAT